MKQLLEKNFSLTLLAFCGLGLVVPQLARLPSVLVVVILGLVIFIACFRLRLNEIREINFLKFFGFYFFRFVFFPAGLYYFSRWLLPGYALALFLLALAPPATSSPAFAHLFKGNVALAFTCTILGNLLTPLVLPLSVAVVVGQNSTLDVRGIFLTLLLSVLLPIAVYALVGKTAKLKHWVEREGSLASIILIGLTFTLAAAKRRELILGSPSALLGPFLISTLGFAAFYVVAWVFVGNAPRKDKITYGLASGANNIALATSLALLYFPPEVGLFLIVAQIPWVLLLTPYRAWIRKGGPPLSS